MLSTLLHCRKQAEALRACQRDGVGVADGCAAQEAAFVTCSQANIGLVIQHLVKIADKHCPSEIDALTLPKNSLSWLPIRPAKPRKVPG